MATQTNTTATTPGGANQAQISQIYNSLKSASQSLSSGNVSGAYNSLSGASNAIPPTSPTPNSYTSKDQGSANYYKDAPGYVPSAANGDRVGNTPVGDTPPVPGTTPGTTPGTQPSPTTTAINPPNATTTTPVVPGSGNAFTGNNLSSLGTVGSNIEKTIKSGLAVAKNSGVTSPAGTGAGSAGVTAATSGVTSTEDPVKNTNDLLAQTPEYQKWLQDVNKLNDTNAQQSSALDFYKNLSSQYNLPDINSQLLNIKAVMDGTQMDIRNEITAAGGFASNSQVLALASTRNQALTLQYNNLELQKQMAQDQINTMVSLYGQDRSYAAEAMNRQLNIDQQSLNIRDKMINNVTEGIKTIKDAEGLSGLYNGAMNVDPSGQSAANIAAHLGITLGEFQQAAQKDAVTRNLDIASKQLALQKAQLDLNPQIPNQARAGQTGYTDNGVKINNDNARQQILKGWITNKTVDQNGGGRVSTTDYNNARAWWVSQGLSANEFDTEFSNNAPNVLSKLKGYLF